MQASGSGLVRDLNLGDHGGEATVTKRILGESECHRLVLALEVEQLGSRQPGLFETGRVEIEAGERPSDIGAGRNGKPGRQTRDEQRRGGIVTERRRSGSDFMESGASYAARPEPTIERVDPERQHRPALALGLRELRTERS